MILRMQIDGEAFVIETATRIDVEYPFLKVFFPNGDATSFNLGMYEAVSVIDTKEE